MHQYDTYIVKIVVFLQVVVALSPEQQVCVEPGLVMVRTGERQRGAVHCR